MSRQRQPAGIPVGGQFAPEARSHANVVLPAETDVVDEALEDRFRDLAAVEPDIDKVTLRSIFEPQKVAANTGRIYDYLRENGIAADSVTREAAFAYAARALDRSYEDFYDAWMTEKPVDLVDTSRAEIADDAAGKAADANDAANPISPATRRAQQAAQDRHRRLETQRVHALEKEITEMTGRERATVSNMSLTQMVAVTERLKSGPAQGFRATGPRERGTIVDQIGSGPVGNVAAISGNRVVPLPDGVELPVSNGISVRVRLASDDTYTVQRVRTRSGADRILGQREGVYADDLSTVAYRAGMFESYEPEEF